MIVNKIPRNTPHDASIYIMGNFNNWNPEDRNYKLIKQVDGTYRILIYSPFPQVQFKFTRGTSSSIESRPGGRMLPNRIANRDMVKGNPDIQLEIASWLDLPDPIQLYSIYDLLLLFSFFQGVLLMVTIPSIQGYNRSANRWLLILIGFTSAILLLKVVSNSSLVEQVVPKLQLLPDFIFFIYAPLFYLYIQKLLFQSQISSSSSNKISFHSCVDPDLFLHELFLNGCFLIRIKNFRYTFRFILDTILLWLCRTCFQLVLLACFQQGIKKLQGKL